jgi:ligand-binding SRPBCC domain-containing protein
MTVIRETTLIRAPIERCFDLARSVEVHLAGNIHWGEQATASAGITSGLLAAGDQVTWRAKHFGVRHRVTKRIKQMDRPAHFQDAAVRGIFPFMRHDHFFRALSGDETEMRDVFAFAAPLPLIGLLAEILFLRRYMRKLLRERNAVIRQMAESGEWRQYLPAS